MSFAEIGASCRWTTLASSLSGYAKFVLPASACTPTRQPDRLKVEGRVSVVPHIWLDGTNPTTASVIIDGSGRNWCRLSYQLGHELGHVLCNSWQANALPLRPTQWLEEILAEAFSLRGLARLADSWSEDPVLRDYPDYAKHLRRYRELTHRTVPSWRPAMPAAHLVRTKSHRS